VEDITDSFEFFVKDIVDLQKYDIVYINGHKNGRISIEKITRTSREILEDEAKTAKKYDKSQTVMYVKTARINHNQEAKQTTETETKEVIPEPAKQDETEIEIKTHFSLPESLATIGQIAKIIKEHTGTMEVKIGELSYKTNKT